jgi:hypothetical protein
MIRRTVIRAEDRIRVVPNSASRASDEDRERVAAVLRAQAVAGRLTLDELDERVGRAFGARTLRELDALLSDLPRDRGHAPMRTVLTLLLQGVLWVLVGVVLVTIAILLALAWAGSRLVAAATARSLASRRVRALRAGP